MGKNFPLMFGPLLFLLACSEPPAAMQVDAWLVLCVTLWMGIWWLTEAVPVPVTALLPLLLFPLLGVGNTQSVAASYANPLIFLFMGGFMVGLALQKWDLHRRMAMAVLRRSGGSPGGLVGGVMAASAFLSMWISNTATSMMMLPIVLALIPFGTRRLGVGSRDADNFRTCMLLGLAYGAAFGGLSTLVGTPPNALLAGFLASNYGLRIGFLDWMLLAMPFSLTMLLLGWLVLTKWIYRFQPVSGEPGKEPFPSEPPGPLSLAQKLVLLIFALVALCWIFRPILQKAIPDLPLSDEGIAVFGALCLLSIPSGQGGALLGWEDTRELPWGVLILFGGGLALAAAINDSGLAARLGESLGVFAPASLWMMLGVLLILMVFLTELTSNTATTATLLPVVAALALTRGDAVELFLVPVTLAASCAFMMPVATPPNAIIYSSGELSIRQMAWAGLWMNGLAVLVLLVLSRWVFLPLLLSGLAVNA